MRVIIFLMLFAFTGEVRQLGEEQETLEMEQVLEDNSDPLIGGRGVIGFPGVFYTSQSNSRCTGTLVGDRVIASAAHCMSNGATLSLRYKGETYAGRCAHSPDYRRNSTADWALCLLTRPITDKIVESINVDPSRVRINNQLLLTGYGCIRQGGGGGNDGLLRAGFAPIVRLPRGSNHDIVTQGQVALCFGDSGGPAFLTEASGKRWQTSINSRGDIRTTSYLSSLSSPAALAFYRDFAARNGVKICGLHVDATGCFNNF